MLGIKVTLTLYKYFGFLFFMSLNCLHDYTTMNAQASSSSVQDDCKWNGAINCKNYFLFVLIILSNPALVLRRNAKVYL